LTRRRKAALSRFAWFVGLWAAGVLVLAGVGYVLRLVLGM
jgi:hypothetical protein